LGVDAAFSGGSLVAAFMQGMMVGALVEGLPISHGEYSGGEFSWLSPFAVICGVGLSLGYTLLGAAGLSGNVTPRCGHLRIALIPYLSLALLVFLVVVFVYALSENLRVMGRWLERPYLFAFPLIAAVAAIVLAVSVRHRRDGPPFYMGALVFAAAFGTFAITFWPT